MSAPSATVTIPEHLKEYITEQKPELYTYIDHALWRYVMRVSKAFFSKTAHPLYLHGLEATGIPTERIPLVQEMDEALQRMGWRAVAINGFIPPAIFLEFQSLKILAIACDIRKLENLGYTPSPDIIHEAAGHAPIVADPDYRDYLEAYGDAARNAIISKHDLDLYQAIFELSELKENPRSSKSEILDAQKKFETIAAQEVEPSEAALLTRMAWWTTEYGLVESDNGPVIYGAGLLSSVSESYACLKPEVKKIPFSLGAVISTKYDITSHQPQLFVAKSFIQLGEALDTFANSMAYRKGGAYGLQVAKTAQNTVTIALDNGVQITGIVENFGTDADGKETFFTLTGSKQVSYLNKASDQLSTHNLSSTLMVPLFDVGASKASLPDIQRKLHGSGLHTKDGSRVQGRISKELTLGGNARVLVLSQATITSADGNVLFQENQKLVPLVLAHQVNSVFGGAADRSAFHLKGGAPVKRVDSHQSNLTAENSVLNDLYRMVREFRESKMTTMEDLQPILDKLEDEYPQDWLLRLELLELFQKNEPNSVTTAQLRTQLIGLRDQNPEIKDLIQRGLELV